MKIIVGSQSIGKKIYFENLFDEYDLEFVLASELGIDEPIEDGKTSYENALIKARHYSKLSGLPCIALDSSLTFLDFSENHEIQDTITHILYFCKLCPFLCQRCYVNYGNQSYGH